METLELPKVLVAEMVVQSNPLALFEAPAVTHQQLKNLEQLILDELVPVEFPLEHAFIDGAYVRKMVFPAGHVAVGKIHSTEHVFILAKGRVLCVTATTKVELLPGDMFTCSPGTKRACYALEDSVFINVHTNKDNDTDLDVLEAKLIIQEAIGHDKKEELKWVG